MPKPYNPASWFWKADDGRIFSSASAALVPATDPSYQAFIADDTVPTSWPRDETGAQTDVALQWVFDNAGLAIRLAPKLLLSPREFIALFTSAEQTALFTARRDNVQIDMFITVAMAGNVDLTNAEVISDINACVDAKLITADRAKAILAGQAPTS